MKRIKCFLEECRYNTNMKCNAPKVSAKLGGGKNSRHAERVFCGFFRPVP